MRARAHQAGTHWQSHLFDKHRAFLAFGYRKNSKALLHYRSSNNFLRKLNMGVVGVFSPLAPFPKREWV